MKQCELTEADTLIPLPASVTLCATVDEGGNEQLITDMMIRRACEMMDGMQVWPCGHEVSSICTHNRTHLARRSADVIPFPANKR